MLVKRVLFIFFPIISCAFADYNNYKQKWLEFKKTYNKQYHTLDEENRNFATFVYNQKKIFKHNQQYSLGHVTYKLKSNEFADLTHTEFLAKYVNYQMKYDSSDVSLIPVHELKTISLPPLVDWRQNGSVTEVQSQGPCHSSYTFATTGALEAQYHRRTGELIKFSEQHLLDCSNGVNNKKYNNSGCHGGSVNESLKFVSDQNGIDTEHNYPFIMPIRCRSNKAHQKINKSNHTRSRVTATNGDCHNWPSDSANRRFIGNVSVLFIRNLL